MDIQRFSIKGRVVTSDDPHLQDALARVHDTPERPRCLCVAGGVEMYVARHRQFVVKRMPDTGSRHHPGCPSFELEAGHSGLGELVGEAVLETEPGRVELRVDFPWVRVLGRSVPRGEPQEAAEVTLPRRRMSLRAPMHFSFERAGLNRWSPAMQGKRNLPIQIPPASGFPWEAPRDIPPATRTEVLGNAGRTNSLSHRRHGADSAD